MDLGRLQEFVLIAQYRSFRKSAEQLGISPAVLSSRFAGFENSLGVKLFRRDAHSVILTDEGRRFLPDAQEIITNYQNSLQRISQIEYNIYRNLKIVIMGLNMPPVLGAFLDIVNNEHPDIHLELLDDSVYSIRDGLQEGRADLYFAYGVDDFQDETIEKDKIFTTHQNVFLPKSHRLAQKATLTLQDLDGERIIPYPACAEPSIRKQQLNMLERSGIRYTLYEDRQSLLFFKYLVPIGKGLSIVPLALRDAPPNSVSIVLEGPECKISLYMLYRKNMANRAALSFVKDFSEFRAKQEEPL